MESHPQNPEFRNNPENFHPCVNETDCTFHIICLSCLMPLIDVSKPRPECHSKVI